MFYYHHCDYYSHHRHYTQMLSLSLPLYLLSQTSANLILQFSSVAQSCPTLCDPMNHSSPGLPVHHQLQSLPKLMSIESVMASNHLILCRPLLLLPSIFPSIRVFSVSQFFASGGQTIGVSALAQSFQ